MTNETLAGQSILVVEDEPLIAMDVAQILSAEGATVRIASTLARALALVKQGTLSAAILDHALSDGDSSALCEELNGKNIPYLIFTGFSDLEGPCSDAPRVEKPASYEELLAAVTQLLNKA